MKQVNDSDFTGSYTLTRLSPYTVYSVYVTAVTLVNGSNQIEGSKSKNVTKRTLAGSKY